LWISPHYKKASRRFCRQGGRRWEFEKQPIAKVLERTGLKQAMFYNRLREYDEKKEMTNYKNLYLSRNVPSWNMYKKMLQILSCALLELVL